MLEKQHEIKSSRNGVVSRYKCLLCGLEHDVLDTKIKEKKCRCKPNNIDNVWKEIKRCSTGEKSGRKPVELNITKNYIIKLFQNQDGKCSISGVDIVLGCNASLDRIDSNKGYIKGNVQWVHKDVNLMKGMFSLPHFLKVCKLCSKS